MVLIISVLPTGFLQVILKVNTNNIQRVLITEQNSGYGFIVLFSLDSIILGTSKALGPLCINSVLRRA